jgi:hypothetical protein
VSVLNLSVEGKAVEDVPSKGVDSELKSVASGNVDAPSKVVSSSSVVLLVAVDGCVFSCVEPPNVVSNSVVALSELEPSNIVSDVKSPLNVIVVNSPERVGVKSVVVFITSIVESLPESVGVTVVVTTAND